MHNGHVQEWIEDQWGKNFYGSNLSTLLDKMYTAVASQKENVTPLRCVKEADLELIA